MAHSLGGAISTRYLQTHTGDYQRAALLSPMLNIDTRLPDRIEHSVIRLAAAVFPESYALSQGDYKLVTKKKKFTQSQSRIDFSNSMTTTFPETKMGGSIWAFINQAMNADEKIFTPAELAKLKGVELHLFTAGSDTIVEPEAQNTFAATLRIPQIHYPQAQHEPFFESDSIRNQFMSDLRKVLIAVPAK